MRNSVLFAMLALASVAAKADEDAISLERKAMKGDYQAQRNLAYSYQTASLGLPKDFMKACMWRTVILQSGNKQVDSSDPSNHDYACGKLSASERIAAVRQGEELAKRLYKK